MNIQKLKWLYPGMLIKRWISLAVFGIFMISMGFVIVIAERNPHNKAMASMVIMLGIGSVIFAVKRILRSLMVAVDPAGTLGKGDFVEKIYEKRILERGSKVVVVGGGTGLSTLLAGLKHRTSNITAIVTVADDGGSSGRLREEFGVLPPGDIRNCLVALSDSEDILGPLFQFRFTQGKGLDGHNFGNLFITALARVTGDFAQAIKESSKVLAIRGNVYPATLETVKLVARRENGVEVEGECRIREEKGSPIERLSLNPADCKATDESVEAIKEADVIILGPGSLYTSVMPNLLIDGIQNAIVKSKATKVYICNVMTEAGETDDYCVSDHIKAIIKHTRPGVVNCCVANVSRIPEDLYERYKAQGQYPVRLDSMDEKWLKDEKIDLVKAQISGAKEFVRHDPAKLTEVIMDVIEG